MHTYILALWGWRQENHEFKIIFSYLLVQSKLRLQKTGNIVKKKGKKRKKRRGREGEIEKRERGRDKREKIISPRVSEHFSIIILDVCGLN